ncbi:MAG: hypothetical protein ACLP9L_18250 [Thermoguttaceae bacterium]
MSTGTTSAIRGGLAYVQAYLDDNPVTQGLAKLRGKMRAWQASLSTLAAGTMGGELPEPFAAIARFAQSPAGAFAALLGAAKFTAAAREEMLRMAEASGVAVDKFSQYAYAARRAGVSNEALASGLKRLESKQFMAAMQGMGGKAGGLKGMTNAVFARMGAGDATDKLRQFVKLAESMPTEEKIGLARRLGLSELLPLINQGVDGLDAFTARAKALGLVMSEEDAKAGKKFEQAFGDLTDVLKSSAGAIGGALVPMITGLTNLIVPVVATIRDWIKEHKYLTVALFAGTGAIVTAGIALKGLSIATGLASGALGILKGAFSLASLVVAGFNAVLGITQALMGSAALPFILVGAAVVGVIAYIGYLGGAFSDFGRQWAGFTKDTTSSIGAIANAISRGDLTAAWDVVTSYFSTEWQRLINTLQGIWEGYRTYFTQVYYGMLEGWNEFTSKFRMAWNEAIGFVKKKWLEFSNSTFTETMANALAPIIARIEGVSTEDVRKNLSQDFAAARRQQAGDEGNIDAQTAAKNAQLRAQRDAETNRLGGLANQAQAESDRRLKEGEAKLKAAHDALDRAQAKANAPGPEEKEKKPPPGFTPGQQSSVAGTFSGAIAGMLGGGGTETISLAREANELHRQEIALSAQWRAEAHELDKKNEEHLSKIAELQAAVT